ncbi:MAG: hypothetical protein K9W44_13325 [Candidatus Lokiarchaeota archaeon]|nr:hypothetical protein [Candidatus Harpocratesius repetitus]
MMIIATIIGELFQEKRILSIIIFGASFSIIGIISSIFLGISKHRVNFSYISLSIGLGALFLILLWYILEHKELSCCNNSIFRPQGRNSFVLYIIHAIILAITVIIIPETISWGIIIVIGLVNVALLWFCAYILDKKKIYLTI